MINYRDIFKVSYGYLMIGVIVIISIGILIVNRKKIEVGLRYLSNACLISGIILMFIDLVIYFGIDSFASYNYKIFIRVISDSFFSNLICISIIVVLVGIALRGVCNVRFSR